MMAARTASALLFLALGTSAVPQMSAPQTTSSTTSTTTTTSDPTPIVSTTPATTPAPTGPVINATIPGGLNPAVWVGSLIGVTSNQTTLAISKFDDPARGTESPFPSLTITVGPTAFHYHEVESNYTVDMACQFSTGGGFCIDGESGPASEIKKLDGTTIATVTAVASKQRNMTFGATYLKTNAITITAGPTADLNSSSSTTASSSSTTNNPVSTKAPGGAQALMPCAAAAGMVGLVALFL